MLYRLPLLGFWLLFAAVGLIVCLPFFLLAWLVGGFFLFLLLPLVKLVFVIWLASCLIRWLLPRR